MNTNEAPVMEQQPAVQGKKKKSLLWPLAIAAVVLAAAVSGVLITRAVNTPKTYAPTKEVLEQWAGVAQAEPDAGAYILRPAGAEGTGLGTGGGKTGNLPALSGMGGFYAYTADWLFYADWTRGGCLYAVSKDEKTERALTDFPVANLNIVDNDLLFTDTSASVTRGYGDETDLRGIRTVYGGTLHRVQGIDGLANAAAKMPEQIGGGDNYYRVCVNDKGVFALAASAQSAVAGEGWRVVQVEDNGNTTAIDLEEGDTAIDLLQHGGLFYLELEAAEGWGEINCFSVETGEFTGSLAGRDMACYGESVFFISNRDNYLYEIKEGEALPRSVSVGPIYSYTLTDDGAIEALCQNRDVRVRISPAALDTETASFAETAYRAGDWYSYFYKPGQDLGEQPAVQPVATPIPQKEAVTTPKTAVELVLEAVRGDSLDDERFGPYDGAAKEKLQSYYGDRIGFCNNFIAGFVEALNDGDLFSVGQVEQLRQALRDYFANITYEIEETACVGDRATVLLTAKTCVNLEQDFAGINLALSAEMARLTLQERDTTIILEQLTSFLASYLREKMPSHQADFRVELNLVWDEILGWVISDMDNLDAALNGLYYYSWQMGTLAAAPEMVLPERPAELQRWAMWFEPAKSGSLWEKGLSLMKSLLRISEPEYTLADGVVTEMDKIQAAYPGAGICKKEFAFSWLSGQKNFFTSAQDFLKF